MELSSLESVILITVTRNCLPFSYSRSIFRRHLSWKVLKIAFRSLQIWEFSGGEYPRPPYKRLVPSALAIIASVRKNLATALNQDLICRIIFKILTSTIYRLSEPFTAFFIRLLWALIVHGWCMSVISTQRSWWQENKKRPVSRKYDWVN